MNAPVLRFKDEEGRAFPEWKEKTLEQLASVERGKFTVRPRNDPRYFGGNIPFVQTGDIVNAPLYLSHFSQTLNADGLKVSKLFPRNTVLITIAANIGDTTITNFDVACTDSVVAIQPKDGISNCVWLKFSLDTKKEELDSKATQNAQKNINLQILKPLVFATPSFAEQTKIANFLTAVDEKISQLTQKHALLTQYKKGVMQQIFSQALRFKDDDGREFPEREEKTLGEVSNIKRGASPRPIADKKWFSENSKIGWVRISDVSSSKKYLDFTEQYLSEAGIGKSRLVKKGNIIMSICATIGKPIYTNFEVCIHDGFVVFEDLAISHEYLYYYLMLIEKNWYQYGQPGSQVNLNSGIVSNEIVFVPCLAEQTKIAQFLTALDDKLAATRAQLDGVKQYKQGLLQQMFV